MDLLLAQHDGEPLLALRASQPEHGPVAGERLLVEELDAAQGLREAARGDLPDDGQVQLDRAVRVATKLEVFGHAAAKGGHPILSKKVERT
ncbi:MAG: hypothetical protein Q8K82_17040 [Gemmatimonadaceae bacterium]|nr:hypothetical protein [Gemmatimonadaceae bacterium]